MVASSISVWTSHESHGPSFASPSTRQNIKGYHWHKLLLIMGDRVVRRLYVVDFERSSRAKVNWRSWHISSCTFDTVYKYMLLFLATKLKDFPNSCSKLVQSQNAINTCVMNVCSIWSWTRFKLEPVLSKSWTWVLGSTTQYYICEKSCSDSR